MTSAVAPLPQIVDLPVSSAMARKRRREILSSQRACVPDLPSSTPTLDLVADLPVAKKRKIAEVSASEESDHSESCKPTRKVASKKGKGSANPQKKPQMKYDPDVPMTKEEAAVWRREQRRKRNRESAAASRQRQRNRIAELEVELDDWKTKFDDVLNRLYKLEELTQTSVTADLVAEIEAAKQTVVSPLSSPSASPRQSPVPTSPVASCAFVDAGKMTSQESVQPQHQVKAEETEKQSVNKMISRPAVKITGAASLLPPPEDSMMLPASLCPDPCVSSSEPTLAPDEDLEITDDVIPSLLNLEDEFGEFLLDAVTWL